MNWVDQSLAIARVELRRSVRATVAQTNKLVGIGIGLFVLGGFSLVGGGALYLFGGNLVDAGGDLVPYARGGAAATWLFATVIVAFRTVSVTGEVDGAAGMLTTVSPKAVVGGLLLAEVVRGAAQFGFPLVVLAVSLALGTGAPLAGLAVLATGVVVVVTAVPAGYFLGQVVRLLARSVPVVRRNRISLSVVAMVAYMLLLLDSASVATVAAGTPLGWPGDAVTLAVNGHGDVVSAVVALAAPVLLTPLFVGAAYRTSVANWYADPVEADDGSGDSGALVSGAGDRLSAVVAGPTAAVVRASWLRARRAPFKLTFAFVPAFAFVGYLAPQLQEGHLPGSLPVMLAGYAAWSVGAAFTLNPLGDEGALLPITITSGVGGRRFVRGRILASWLVGVVPTAALVVVASVVVGDGPTTMALGVAYATVLTLAAPTFAVGIGVAMPNFDSQRVMMNREAVAPSVVAFFVFLLVLGLVALPGALALFGVPTAVASGPAVAVVRGAGVALSALLGLVAGVPAYVYAVRTFDGYQIDRA